MPVDAGHSGDRVIAANKRFFDWCRTQGIPVVHLVTTYRDAEEIRAQSVLAHPRRRPERTAQERACGTTSAGMPGCTVMPGCSSQRDWVVDTKKRYDCFVGTDLDFVLRAHGINTLLITGVNTNSAACSPTVTAACCRDLCGDRGRGLRRHHGRAGAARRRPRLHRAPPSAS